jgi:hypothetical protein
MKFSEDDRFIQFLQLHQPKPPPATEDREAALMLLLETHAQQSPPKPRSIVRMIWLVPTAIAAGMTVLWSQYKPFVLIPEFAQGSGFTSFVNTESIAPTEEGLEAYLTTSWSNVVEPRSYAEIELYGYTEMLAETVP